MMGRGVKERERGGERESTAVFSKHSLLCVLYCAKVAQGALQQCVKPGVFAL